MVSARLQALADSAGPGWTTAPSTRGLVDWVAETAPAREAAIYELSRLTRRYEETYERRLNVAEHLGKRIELSIAEGKFEGVQSPNGLLYQLREDGKAQGIRGAKDKDRVRTDWGMYRGVVHLGIAMDLFGERPAYPPEVLFLAEAIRLRLSQTCPKGTRTPYVPSDEQISFVYAPGTWGPRFRNRGLPFHVTD